MKPWDRRIFLIAVALFGVAGTRAGHNWLSAGSIVIGDASGQVGVDAPPRRPHPPVAGTIQADDLLFYPLCVTWIALGVSMIALAVLTSVTSIELFLRLSSYSSLAFLLLAVATLAAAYWPGP